MTTAARWTHGIVCRTGKHARRRGRRPRPGARRWPAEPRALI